MWSRTRSEHFIILFILDQNSFRALYRTFTQCCFVEDEGDIVFYKNREGKAARVLAEHALDGPVAFTG